MRRLGIAPKLSDLVNKNPMVDTWLATATNRFNVYSDSADPTVDEVPENQWVVYRNTTTGEIKVWVNDNGVLKSTPAFT